MDSLTTFLQQQTIFQIAPKAEEPWIANVLMLCDAPPDFYFVGSQETLYGSRLKENKTVAFATAWHDPHDHRNRKGIQAVGEARIVTDEVLRDRVIAMHNAKYPEFASSITPEYIVNNGNPACVWAITARFIKFWNDEEFGQDGSTEFHF